MPARKDTLLCTERSTPYWMTYQDTRAMEMRLRLGLCPDGAGALAVPCNYGVAWGPGFRAIEAECCW